MDTKYYKKFEVYTNDGKYLITTIKLDFIREITEEEKNYWLESKLKRIIGNNYKNLVIKEIK